MMAREKIISQKRKLLTVAKKEDNCRKAPMQMVGENSRDAADQTCTKGLAGRAGRGLNFMEASSNVNRRSWTVEYVLLGFTQMANSKYSMRPYIAG